MQYSTENLEPPILTVEDAVRRSSFFDIPPFLYPQNVGNQSEGMEKAEHKILSAEVILYYHEYFLLDQHKC